MSTNKCTITFALVYRHTRTFSFIDIYWSRHVIYIRRHVKNVCVWRGEGGREGERERERERDTEKLVHTHISMITPTSVHKHIGLCIIYIHTNATLREMVFSWLPWLAPGVILIERVLGLVGPVFVHRDRIVGVAARQLV